MQPLALEAEAVFRQFIRLNLEARGWTVIGAENAIEGLRIFRQLHPRLVTLDMIMPIVTPLDAPQLAKLMLEEDPEVTVLVVSVMTPAQVSDHSQPDRKLEFFTKPGPDGAEFHKLLARIDRLYSAVSTFDSEGFTDHYISSTPANPKTRKIPKTGQISRMPKISKIL